MSDSWRPSWMKRPLRSASVHAVFCINALDHFHAPYEGIEEAIRVLRPGGRLVLSTDVGGTPGHPCRIVEGDLDEALVHSGRFDVVERRCSTELPSTWPVELKIPLFVFQGLKRSSEPESSVFAATARRYASNASAAVRSP